jgi:copper chaperone NosL
MAVSDVRFAAQIVAPGEEPRFFDDIGCLRDHLAEVPLPADAAVFVADYRTKAWIPARSAVYLQHDGIQTPMGSHVVAFADPASRAADAAAAGGSALTAEAVFGARLLP